MLYDSVFLLKVFCPTYQVLDQWLEETLKVWWAMPSFTQFNVKIKVLQCMIEYNSFLSLLSLTIHTIWMLSILLSK